MNAEHIQVASSHLSAPHCSLSSDIKSACIYRDLFAARRCTPNGVIFRLPISVTLKKIIPFMAVEDYIYRLLKNGIVKCSDCRTDLLIMNGSYTSSPE
jgi:hypothetical protein